MRHSRLERLFLRLAPFGASEGVSAGARPGMGTWSAPTGSALAASLLVIAIFTVGMGTAMSQPRDSAGVAPPIQQRLDDYVTDLTHIVDRASRKVSPSLVRLTFLEPKKDGGSKTDKTEQWRLCLGVVVSSEGHILANGAAIPDNVDVQAWLPPEQRHKAHLVARDNDFRLALLKVDADGLVPAQFGEPKDLKAGDWLVSITPCGFAPSAGLAILLDAKQSQASTPRPDPFLRVALDQQAAKRGGILVDSKGRVVGIALCSSTGKQDLGIALAAPISLADKLLARR